MSSWPLISDFSKMLQNPKIGFRDTALRDCTIEKNNLGQPKPRSGNFATVYRGYRPDGSEFAIRVFNRAGDSRRERYQLVNDYLKERAVWSLVDFTYDEKGIRSASDGKLYPLLTMDWVPGVTLFEWARDRSREGYQQALTMGADVWLQLVRHLATNDIVHGDLQHGNVLVSAEGYFKLVDYDCMAVPQLMGQPNMEIGVVPYQHPARDAETKLFPGLDNFSALVIYVALRALAAQPSLWHTYVDQTGYDKMLFRKEDFDNPNASGLYRDLMNSPDEQVRDLTHYLFQLTGYDQYKVPNIDEVLLWCQSLGDLLSQRDWDGAVQLVRRMGAGEQIAQDLLPMVDEAQRRVACREALQRAIESGNEAEIQRCYIPELLDDYAAAAPLVAKAKEVGQGGQVLQVLDTARRTQNWNAFKQTWRQHQASLANRPEAEPFKQEIIKLLKVDAVRRVLADPRADDKAVLDVWNQLQALGGHVSAEPLRPEIQRRTERLGSFSKIKELLDAAPNPPTMAHDKKLLEAWETVTLDGSAHAAGIKKQCQAAKRRVEVVEQLMGMTDDSNLRGEKTLIGSAKHFNPSYHPIFRRRLQQAKERLNAYRQLRDAFPQSEGDEFDPWQSMASDMQIMEGWRALEHAGGQKMASEEVVCRVQLAAERVPLIKALQLIGDKIPPDEQIRRVLRVWKEDLLNTCHDAKPWQKIYEQAKARGQGVQLVEEALAAGAVKKLQQLTADAADKALLPPELLARVEEAIAESQRQRTARTHGLTNALLENDRSAFHDLFEPAAIGQICEQYPHHQPVVSRWTETEILPLSRSGLAAGEPPIEETEEEGSRRFRWIWPPENITRRCRLAVCKDAPPANAGPDDVEALFTQDFPRDSWDEAGVEIETPAEWHGAHVIVWAVVDLGFDVFHTQPLNLGQLQLVKKRRWFG